MTTGSGNGASTGLNSTTPGSGINSNSATGLNTSGVNQPGVPNTTTPGTIGTGAVPSGLPGDDPAHPGYPAKIGK
jgi:hypothetical protein